MLLVALRLACPSKKISLVSGALLIGTWSFAQRGIESALPPLLDGGDPLDACEVVCSAAEQDESVDSVGYGGLPDASGAVTLDASVMRSPSECGSVSCLRRHLDATHIARLVMDKTPHVMLAGHAVDGFASAHGLDEQSLLAPGAREAWLRWKCDQSQVDQSRDSSLRPRDAGKDSRGALFNGKSDDESRWTHHDTIGILARTATGEMAGACSTSGTPFKQPGRVGDSPIVGHGLYVEPEVGMAVGTGEGELLMGVCGAFAAIEAMRGGASPFDAALKVLNRIDGAFELKEHHQIGLIVCDTSGNYATVALRDGFRAVVGDAEGVRVIEPEHVLYSGT